jgi:hypothetical protein
MPPCIVRSKIGSMGANYKKRVSIRTLVFFSRYAAPACVMLYGFVPNATKRNKKKSSVMSDHLEGISALRRQFLPALFELLFERGVIDFLHRYFGIDGETGGKAGALAENHVDGFHADGAKGDVTGG